MICAICALPAMLLANFAVSMASNVPRNHNKHDLAYVSNTPRAEFDIKQDMLSSTRSCLVEVLMIEPLLQRTHDRRLRAHQHQQHLLLQPPTTSNLPNFSSLLSLSQHIYATTLANFPSLNTRRHLFILEQIEMDGTFEPGKF